jgi:hypothetical protein
LYIVIDFLSRCLRIGDCDGSKYEGLAWFVFLLCCKGLRMRVRLRLSYEG